MGGRVKNMMMRCESICEVGGGTNSKINSVSKMIPTATTTNSCDQSKKGSSSTNNGALPSSSCHNMMSSSFKLPASHKFDQVALLQDHPEQVDVVDDQNDRCLWELFADQLLDQPGDFMISSPQFGEATSDSHNSNCMNYNYYGQQGQSTLKSLMVWSPPRGGVASPTHAEKEKGKSGLSPVLDKVFNSPNSQYNYMQVESLSLPALDEFLDDLDKDDDEFGKVISSDEIDLNGIITCSSSSDCFDLSTVPELLDCIQAAALPNSSSRNRFSTTNTNQQQQHMIDDDDIDVVYDQLRPNAPNLLQQLEQERQQEKQQRDEDQPYQQDHPPQQLHHQHDNINSSSNNCLMLPLSIGSQQEQQQEQDDQEQDSGLRLVHLLLACAEAVAKEDYMLGRRYLHHLNRVVSPLGDSMQRVASCFAEALAARLAATLTTTTPNIKPPTTSLININPFPDPANSPEILNIYQILYQACPYIKFAHFTANQAIFEAFEAEERVHVIDLDILQGYQWPAFMQALAARPGGAPFLRITGVGPSPESVRETGRCLTELAHSLHIPFEFHPVGEQLQDLKPHMFHRRIGEALAVNSVSRLHRVPANCLGNLLGMIRDQAPNIVTVVEQEASHNGPYFLGRFLEALHYYSAIFDSLDATFPPDSAQRAKLEQYIFAPEIRNIVASEGAERVLRHERLEKWRKSMQAKGFQGVALSANAVTQSKILLGLYSCDGYRLTEDNGCLLLGWQDRPILAASAWRC